MLSNRTIGLVVTWAAVVVTVAVVAMSAWRWLRLDGVAIGFHGWTAMALGVSATVLIAGGLSVLSVYSARHGHDDIEIDSLPVAEDFREDD